MLLVNPRSFPFFVLARLPNIQRNNGQIRNILSKIIHCEEETYGTLTVAVKVRYRVLWALKLNQTYFSRTSHCFTPPSSLTFYTDKFFFSSQNPSTFWNGTSIEFWEETKTDIFSMSTILFEHKFIIFLQEYPRYQTQTYRCRDASDKLVVSWFWILEVGYKHLHRGQIAFRLCGRYECRLAHYEKIEFRTCNSQHSKM